MKDHPLIKEISSQALDSQVEGIADPAERRKQIESYLAQKNVAPDDIQKVLQSTGRDRERILFEIGRKRVWEQMNNFQVVGAVFVAFWLHLLFLAMLGFAYSYFWSVSTIIYFLLRKRVDDVDMEEVYLEKADEDVYPTLASPAVAAAAKAPAAEPARPPEPSRPQPSPPEPAPSAAPPAAKPVTPETDSPQSESTP
jgi:hypothetical protein